MLHQPNCVVLELDQAADRVMAGEEEVRVNLATEGWENDLGRDYCADVRLSDKGGNEPMVVVEVLHSRGDHKGQWAGFRNFFPVSILTHRRDIFKGSMGSIDLPDPDLAKSTSSPIHISISSYTTTPSGFGAN